MKDRSLVKSFRRTFVMILISGILATLITYIIAILLYFGIQNIGKYPENFYEKQIPKIEAYIHEKNTDLLYVKVESGLNNTIKGNGIMYQVLNSECEVLYGTYKERVFADTDKLIDKINTTFVLKGRFAYIVPIGNGTKIEGAVILLYKLGNPYKNIRIIIAVIAMLSPFLYFIIFTRLFSTSLVKKINYDFSNAEHSLIIVQTGRGHADLSADYSSIPQEMNKVAEYFGKKVLREISIDDVLDQFSKLRAYAKDRAVLRALHFFEENERVDREIAALEKNDFESFLKNIAASGNSSWKYLQNCYTTAEVNVQGISLTLALSERFLEQKGCGVCRVHGGGFAGVIMAMVPDAIADEYIQYIERYMGEGNAHRMRIRPMGSICVQSMLD